MACFALLAGIYFIYQQQKEINSQILFHTLEEMIQIQSDAANERIAVDQTLRLSVNLVNRLDFFTIYRVKGEVFYIQGIHSEHVPSILKKVAFTGSLDQESGYYFIRRTLIGPDRDITIGFHKNKVWLSTLMIVSNVTFVVIFCMVVASAFMFIHAKSKLDKPLFSIKILKEKLHNTMIQMMYGSSIRQDFIKEEDIHIEDKEIKSAILDPMRVLNDLVFQKNMYQQFASRALSEEDPQKIYSYLYQSIQNILPLSTFVALEVNHSVNRFEIVFSSNIELTDSFLTSPGSCYLFKTSGGLYIEASSLCNCVFPVKDQIALCIPIYSNAMTHGICRFEFQKTGLDSLREIYGFRISDEELLILLKNTFRSFVDIAGLASANLRPLNTYKNQAITDTLTGLYNRRYIIETLTHLIAISTRGNGELSIMMVDIDYFKKFNDEYGHEMGDRVLRIVAKELKNSLRDSDIIGRYGGEEFIIILPDFESSEPDKVAEKIRHTIEHIDYAKFGLNNIPKITISIGIAKFPSHGYSYYHLINAADKALYEAKREGRNRVRLHKSLPDYEELKFENQSIS